MAVRNRCSLLKKYLDLAIDYGQRVTAFMIATNYQLVLNLTGRSEKMLTLSQGALVKCRREFE